MAVNWSIYRFDDDVVRFSNKVFEELIEELRKEGVRFSKLELNTPYYEGLWSSAFCREILGVIERVADRLIMKDPYWIEILPKIVRAVRKVARDSELILFIG